MNLHGWKRTGLRLKWTSSGMMVKSTLNEHKELAYNRYRQVSINTVKPSISRKIINEGGSSLEPSENSSKEMARLTYGLASAFIACPTRQKW